VHAEPCDKQSVHVPPKQRFEQQSDDWLHAAPAWEQQIPPPQRGPTLLTQPAFQAVLQQ
jgi:hypothetical protein